ncbi:IclR family transcriptional regulator [Mesorhizobium sp. M9A.F.Ca.ET.002.03.1.2]|uniref:IclR family transcriptional regulator domain-containing protein n=1 Tax=Mesorhizobium sp. M9A.F.Ca.ET.002.03.1.2 TaxID=2493668 RepID=UPI000F7507FA|nr:IclR family transcriptional regulator C-terminal domain-containing protein [Mesorhizobium sp. M9A.F.Ca.ET.002.03.1.2]AZN96082.1 IclR family transcriptional regulator [Mesorhizobium sp. M9A.F.Ca.ET.002.03.1.2]
MDDEGTLRDHVGSLERGLVVMEILARHPTGMTLTEMAEEAGLSRAGARRFLLTLVSTGYATQSGRLFSLSPRLLTVARTWLGSDSLWTFAAPVMREVAAQFDEACNAAVLSGEDVVYVARIPGRRILSVTLDVGTRLPAYCTSMGRVLLAGLAPDELETFLGQAKIERRTAMTITKLDVLTKAIHKAKADGFAIVDEELELGLRSIAVPISDRAGHTVAAINVSTQSARFSVEDMQREILPALLRAKQRVEEFFFV